MRFSFCERVRKAAASKRNPRRVERAINAEQSSTPDGCDKSRSPVEVEMIAYAGERAVLDKDLLSGLPLYISVLDAEQPSRSQQSRCLSSHDLDRIETVITREQGERWIVIAHLGDDGFKSVQRNVRRVGDHQINAAIELRQRADHVLDV
jgi:hypothetical protein